MPILVSNEVLNLVIRENSFFKGLEKRKQRNLGATIPYDKEFRYFEMLKIFLKGVLCSCLINSFWFKMES